MLQEEQTGILKILADLRKHEDLHYCQQSKIFTVFIIFYATLDLT